MMKKIIKKIIKKGNEFRSYLLFYIKMQLFIYILFSI
jgi:hypothetical protein